MALSEVAQVVRSHKERVDITHVDGRESVEVAVFKEGDANIVTTARLVRESLPEMARLVPEGYELTVLFDQSRFIEQALVEVRSLTFVSL